MAKFDPVMFGREVGRLVNEAIDQRLGTQRPDKSRCLNLPLTNVRKFLSNGKRIVRGLASTESLDRQGDRVDPKGGKWSTPLPLLFGHSHHDVIGVVRQVRVTPRGLEIEAEIAEGIGRADEVWQLIELGGLSFYSIGFLGLRGDPIPTGTYWRAWDLVEVSIVAVPAQPEARIERSGKGGIPLISIPRGSVRLVKVTR